MAKKRRKQYRRKAAAIQWQAPQSTLGAPSTTPNPTNVVDAINGRLASQTAGIRAASGRLSLLIEKMNGGPPGASASSPVGTGSSTIASLAMLDEALADLHRTIDQLYQ